MMVRNCRFALNAGTLLVCTLFVSFSMRAAAKPATSVGSSVPIASGGRPQVSIVLGEAAGELGKLAAAELQRYLRTLSGAEMNIITEGGISSRPAREGLILVGGPTSSRSIREAAEAKWVNFNGLKPEGFVIKTGRWENRPAAIVGGNDDAATLYGVYELIEQLGVTFQLTGDVIPAPRADLAIPPLDLRREPAFARRGFLLGDVGYDNLTMFSYQDYAKLLDQMAKMKFNYLQFWWFSFEPWLKFSYRGEPKWMGDVSTKASGYFTWAHEGFGSRTTDDVSIGKQWFKGRRIAPPEMQQVETPDQAFDMAQGLLQRIIRYAKSRGIKVWPAIELATLPPNLARYCERVGDLPFNPIHATFVHPLDPVNREIQVNRFQALVETYPEAEGYFLVYAEDYPELDNAKYHDFFVQQRPAFHDLRALRWPWIIDIPQSSDRVVDSNIGFTDLFKFLMTKRDEIAPKVKVGMMGVGRGYALPVLDKMLPKDVPFTDMDSSGVWTPRGVPMEDFGGMGDRERTLEPRVDDDINMMGMQFNVKQYSAKDRIFVDGVKYGLSGFAGQLNRARGTESNTRFLSEAAWSPQLTTEEFYKNYSTRLFGERAGPEMFNVYMTLEENETWLGYYSYGYSTMLGCCGELDEVSTAYHYSQQDNPFDGPTGSDWATFISKSPDVTNRFEGSIRLLNKALEGMHAALPKVAPQGKYELGYMINRTESYRDYLQSLITIRHAYIDFDRAFKDRTYVSYAQFVVNLEQEPGRIRRGQRASAGCNPTLCGDDGPYFRPRCPVSFKRPGGFGL